MALTLTFAEQGEPAQSATVQEFDSTQDAVFSTELDDSGSWNDPAQTQRQSNTELFANG